jgi:hypothetical protein
LIYYFSLCCSCIDRYINVQTEAVLDTLKQREKKRAHDAKKKKKEEAADYSKGLSGTKGMVSSLTFICIHVYNILPKFKTPSLTLLHTIYTHTLQTLQTQEDTKAERDFVDLMAEVNGRKELPEDEFGKCCCCVYVC